MSKLNYEDALAYIRSQVELVPEIGIVCGSGLSGLTDSVENAQTLKYTDIPGFPQSTVEGHAGELVFGDLGGKPVVCMRGRFHFYEGYSGPTLGFGVQVMVALGIKLLIATNAAGATDEKYQVGDAMIITDHVYFPGMAGNHVLRGHNDKRFGPRFPPTTDCYDPELREILKATAQEIDFKRPVQEGCYYCLSGPTYETRHEIELIRQCGGQAVGMSTAPEIIVAVHAGIKAIGLSVITNRCLGPNDHWGFPNHQEVLDVVGECSKEIQRLFIAFVGKVDTSSMPRSGAFEAFKNTTAVSPVFSKPIFTKQQMCLVVGAVGVAFAALLKFRRKA